MSQITTKVGIVDSNGNTVDQSILNAYQAANKDEDPTGVNPAYYGFVDTIGNWYIQRVTATDIDFAKGLTSYPTNWTNRTGLSYAKFDVVF